MHYYQFNIGDYSSHTKHLSPTEDICYRRLLDYYYLHEQPIPNDLAKVTRLLCLNKEYITDVEQILNEFFTITNDGWINQRADKEIKQYQSFKTAGAAGAAKRWAKPDNSETIGGLSGGLTGANAKQETITTKHKTLNSIKPIRANALDEEFEQFWKAYPKKKDKQKAKLAWHKHKPPLDDVLFALSWQRDCDDWKKENGKYIKHPERYLNAGSWQDEQPVIESPF